MKLFNRAKGVSGEMLAINYLKKNKYKILEQNYKNKIGEIDIIASQKDTLIFIEVKARSYKDFGSPCEAVDVRKQNKIRLVASGYLKEKRLFDTPVRFDVIEILDDKINYIENAF